MLYKVTAFRCFMASAHTSATLKILHWDTFGKFFWGGDGMGLLTSAENLEKFGKIWKIAKIQGGDRV